MGPKIAIGVLVLLLVLFLVVLRHGGRYERPPAENSDSKTKQNSDSKTKQSDAAIAAAANYQPSAWVTKLGGLLAPLSPKLKLSQTSFTFGALPVKISIPAADQKFRNATFRVVEGCRTVPTKVDYCPSPIRVDCLAVSICYSSGGKGHNGLDDQPWRGKCDDPAVGSLVILENGGSLTFKCPSRCTVVLE
jgi:hypothetical protein